MRLLVLSYIPCALTFFGALCVTVELRGSMPNRQATQPCRRGTEPSSTK